MRGGFGPEKGILRRGGDWDKLGTLETHIRQHKKTKKKNTNKKKKKPGLFGKKASVMELDNVAQTKGGTGNRVKKIRTEANG